MNRRKQEGVAVARLYGIDQTSIVGLVYQWDTFELCVLWLDKCQSAEYISLGIGPDILARAREATPSAQLEFLMALKACGT